MNDWKFGFAMRSKGLSIGAKAERLSSIVLKSREKRRAEVFVDKKCLRNSLEMSIMEGIKNKDIKERYGSRTK